MPSAVLFSTSQSFDHKQLLSPFLISAHQPEIKRGRPLAVGERKPNFLVVFLLVAGPTGKFYVSH